MRSALNTLSLRLAVPVIMLAGSVAPSFAAVGDGTDPLADFASVVDFDATAIKVTAALMGALGVGVIFYLGRKFTQATGVKK